MRDRKHSKTAIDELNVIASVIVLLVITVLWLIFMEFLSTKLLLFLSSQLLLVVFMFGNTAKTVFEAVIFVFVVHPFDVGDRCVVGGVQASLLGPNLNELFKHVKLNYDATTINPVGVSSDAIK